MNVQVEQGYEINRPSILRLRASERDGVFDINVGGKEFWWRGGVGVTECPSQELVGELKSEGRI